QARSLFQRFVIPSATQMSECRVAGNLREPAAQSLGVPKIMKLPPRREERFLGGIFARGEIAKNSQGNSATQRLMSRDDLDESALVTSARGADQFAIRWA